MLTLSYYVKAKNMNDYSDVHVTLYHFLMGPIYVRYVCQISTNKNAVYERIDLTASSQMQCMCFNNFRSNIQLVAFLRNLSQVLGLKVWCSDD